MLLNNLYQTPGYSNYSISEDGRVFNTLTNTELSGSRNPAGYWNFRLKDDSGYIKTLGRHYLLALIFLPNTNNERTQVNHINGIKGDDRLSNLEWCTPRENVIHAGFMGITPKCIPIEVRDIVTGDIFKFDTLLECSHFFNMSKDEISRRINGTEYRVYPEKRQYRKLTNKPWPEIPSNTEFINYGRSRAVMVRDVTTNTVIIYSKLSDLSKEFNVHLSTLLSWVNNPQQLVYLDKYQLQWYSDNVAWRPVYDLIRENNTKNKRARCVVVTNTDTGEETIFKSLKECSIEFNIPVSVICYRCTNSPNTTFGNYRFRYY